MSSPQKLQPGPGTLQRAAHSWTTTARVLLVLLALTACGTPTNQPAEPPAGGEAVALPSGAATIIGQITQLDDGGMLVEENPGQPDTGRKIVFQLDGNTTIAERVGDDIQARTRSALATGQRVAVWADGALAGSYPEQGRAAAVVIALPAP